jgi:D-alanyl-D-alanine carboxypeptidase
MSAQANDPNIKPYSGLDVLAPKFRAAVEAALADCNGGPGGGFKAMVFESYRTPELQRLYYARGRTIIPPTHTVTNAPTNVYSWHGYGLAVDVVHAEKYWNPPDGEAWFAKVADVFKTHGCKWGGDWTHPDTPHFQWGRCKASPSERARDLLAAGGLPAVWAAVEAD